MLTISYRYRVDIDSLTYLVYIVDIAMLTISCRYRVDIGTLLYLVYIVNIVDIAMSTISCRYRVDIVTLSYFVYIVYIVDIAKSKVYNCFIKSAKILHDIGFDHNKWPWRCLTQLKVGAKWCAYIATSHVQEHAHKTLRSKQKLMRKPAFSLLRHGDDKYLHSEVRPRKARLDQLRTSKISQNSYSFHESRCWRYGRYKHDNTSMWTMLTRYCVYIVHTAMSTMSTMSTW